jgi:hypothetical protein
MFVLCILYGVYTAGFFVVMLCFIEFWNRSFSLGLVVVDALFRFVARIWSFCYTNFAFAMRVHWIMLWMFVVSGLGSANLSNLAVAFLRLRLHYPSEFVLYNFWCSLNVPTPIWVVLNTFVWILTQVHPPCLCTTLFYLIYCCFKK